MFIASLFITTPTCTTTIMILLSLACILPNVTAFASASVSFLPPYHRRTDASNLRHHGRKRQTFTPILWSFPTTTITTKHATTITTIISTTKATGMQLFEAPDRWKSSQQGSGSEIGSGSGSGDQSVERGERISVVSNSFQKIEQSARGKYDKPQKWISHEIIKLFQSIRNQRRSLEGLTRELIDAVTTSRNGESTMFLTELMIPADQTSLIGLLGSKDCHESMLKLLRHCTNKMSIRDAQYAYTAAIRSLAQSSSENIRRQAIGLIDEMNANGIPPNTYTFTAAFLSVGGGKASMQLLNKAQDEYKGHVDSDIHLYNACIHACSRCGKDGKNGWKNALALFRREMPRKGIQPNEHTYASLLHACANAGQYRVVFTILDEMRKSESGKFLSCSNQIWSAILRACATAGDGAMAMEIMKQMIQSAIYPNTLDCNSVLAALAKESCETDGTAAVVALDFLEHVQMGRVVSFFFKNEECPSGGVVTEDVSIDIISVNTVLKAYANSGDYMGTKLLLERLRRGEFVGALNANTGKRFAIHPDIISYNTLLSVCPNPQDAIDIMNEIRMSRKNRYTAVKPTTVTYANAISVCRRFNPPDLETALKLLKEADQKDGITPNVYMYSAVIWTAEKCGDAKTAWDLLMSMKANGCDPNIVAYNGVISALSSQGRLQQVCQILDMAKKNNVKPNSLTFQKVVLACQKSDCSTEVVVGYLQQILKDLDESERTMDKCGPIYNSLIRAYGKLNDFESALRVFEEIDIADTEILSSILFVCATVKPVRWQDAIIILHSSDIVTGSKGKGRVEYSALSYAVIACSKMNQWQEGLNLLDIYGVANDVNGPMASVDALNSLIASAGRSGRPDIAIKILNGSTKLYSIVPNFRSFRSAIIACNQAEHEKRRQRRRRERLIYKDATYTNIDLFTTGNENPRMFQWWEAALSLFRRMIELGFDPDQQTYSSVISACQTAGQWQRAIGVLRTMTNDKKCLPNKFCLNAAIAACEKGDAWLEAVEIYERMKHLVKPDFVTINSLLIALEKSGQKELAENIYRDALKEKIVQPWKWALNARSEKIRILDLHHFSVPMAKIAVRYVIMSLLGPRPVHDATKDLVFVVGKGIGSEDGIRMLMPNVQHILQDEFGLKSSVDKTNSGRLLVESEELAKLNK